ncbi:hypothetical protein GF338_10345 [candidate division WOR-3 bacterium]|nr:hypothetical protein [candidate division WOR-3 bacterium]
MERIMTGRFLLPVWISFLLFCPMGAADIEGWFFHDDIRRSYLLHIPPQHNGEDSLPLVISMHGYTGNAAQLATYTGMNSMADAEGFYVVYPEGTGTLQSWNAGQCCGDAVANDIDDVGFISVLIDNMVRNYVVDTLRIYVTGMSNGGMMSHRLACELSERIASAAPVAGGLMLSDWEECKPQRSVPVIHFHAVDDGVVPYYGGFLYGIDFPPIDSVMQGWAERSGCDVGPDTTDTEGAFSRRWYQSDGDAEVILWTTEDGGHSWPGRPGGSQAISANEEMWKFFEAHPMQAGEPAINERPEVIIYPLVPAVLAETVPLRFSLKHADDVTIGLYDAVGRRVADLSPGILPCGMHSIEIDCSGLSAGVYFCRLNTSSIRQTYLIKVVR